MIGNFLVSLIVPVYNTEKYLKRCLNSILAQDCCNIQVILVNDGSTDESPTILQTYADQYDNFLVIHQDNKGVSAARNAGLEAATGDYIGFVDSDDFIYPNFCSYLLGIMGDADIAIAGREKYIGDVYASSKKAPQVTEIDSVTALNYLMCSKYNTRSACGRLIKKSTMGNIRFVEDHVYEEIRYSADTFLRAKTIVLADKDLYSYRVRQGSIMTVAKNKQLIDLSLAIEYIYNLLCDRQVFTMCEEQFRLWLVRSAVKNMGLFIENGLDYDTYKMSAKIILRIYKEIGGIGGRTDIWNGH